MARQRRTTRLSVVLNGRLVGLLERAPNGAISFTYDDAWLTDDERAIPVSLSLPLREDRYSGPEVSDYFDNLLPENEQIRRIVAQKVGADGIDAFNLLSRIGRDCVGALQFLPEGVDIPAPGPPESVAVDDTEIADVIRNLATAPLGIEPDGEREFRISIAGMQEKTAFLWNDGWCRPKGATPTTHIFKPQVGELPNGLDMTQSVENEHFCLTLCRQLDLDTAQSKILDFGDVRVLAVERFDRLKSKDGRLLRLPQEDFCQALSVPATLKYNADGGPGIQECLSLLKGSDEGDDDRLAFLKSQIIYWLMAAIDGHAKNFSIFLMRGGRFKMTPIYDVMSAQPNLAQGKMRRKNLKLAMAVGNNRHYIVGQILPRHFLQTADATNIPSDKVTALFHEIVEAVPNAIDRTVQAMPSGFPIAMTAAITDGIHSRLRLLQEQL